MEGVEKKSHEVVVAGDFNHADEKCPMVWKRLLSTLKVFDVHPTLATYFACLPLMDLWSPRTGSVLLDGTQWFERDIRIRHMGYVD